MIGARERESQVAELDDGRLVDDAPIELMTDLTVDGLRQLLHSARAPDREAAARADVLDDVVVRQQVDPMVRMRMGDHDAVDGVEVDVLLQVGERAGSGVQPEGHAAAAYEVAAAGAAGSAVGAAATEDGELHR